jgi:hypothetical protein
MAMGRKKYLRTFVAGSLLLGGAITTSLSVGLLPATATTAVSLYVSPTGTDYQTCSESSPCNSPRLALLIATRGTYSGEDVTIHVAAGDYGQPQDSVNASSLNSLTIAGAGARSTRVVGFGGSVFLIQGGTVTISGLTVTNVHASTSLGGGIDIEHGTLTINSSTVSGNNAREGGGIYNEGTLTINSSTVSGNTSDYGGGIDNGDGTLTINSSTVSGNRASRYGGGIVNGGRMTIYSSTVSDDAASQLAGGIVNSGAYSLTIGATIVAGNPGGNCDGAATTSLGYDLTDDATGTACGMTASTDVVNASPDLGALAYNGGPTNTMLPGTGSPAVGVIPASPATSFCPRTDQRELASVGNCTIGAAEVDVCATGLHPRVLTAHYATGTFTGLFCVNAKGYGTYFQDGLSGPGHVYVFRGYTIITASGTQTRLLGITKGTFSKFTEVAPVPIKEGHFKLT